ncbi:MAG: NADP-dependent oxidoreductase [Chthoniobacterales bacterium]
MRVFRFNDSLSSPALISDEIPIPTPGSGQKRIRIYAAGVTRSELVWYPTAHALNGAVRTGAIPGHEFSGVVDAVGSDLCADDIGQPVFGMNDWFTDGATAEYCLAPVSSLAPKPAGLTHMEAAAVPISALTAWQGLFDRAKLQSGERVLIHGGSGAVGTFAIQFAHHAGAHVITTASHRNFAFLAGIGANEVIDYHASKFEELAGTMDIVFDLVGGETLRRSWSLLKKEGRMVTIAADSEGQKDERTKSAFFIVQPNGAQLTEISRLFEQGSLRVFVDAEVPLARASEAYCGTIENRKGRGKTVIFTTN